MTETLDDVTSAVVETLRARVERLEQRVAELEAHRRPRASQDRSPADDVEAPQLPALPQGGLALAGRSLLVLAGAYLFRALTDAGALPPRLGVALGLAYAAFFQLQADRDARGGRRASAVLHGLTASAIAFPLIWETTARFGMLGSGAAGVAVVGFAVLGLAVVLAPRPQAERLADDARRLRHGGGGARVDASAGDGARHAAGDRRGAGVAGLPRRVARPALVRRRVHSTPSPCCSSRSAREPSRRRATPGSRGPRWP